MKVQSRVLSGLVLLPLAVIAQVRQLDVAPLRNWAAPPYWQASESERDVAGLSPRAQSPPNSLVFVGMTPCRVVDTRSGQGFPAGFGPPSLAAGANRTFQVQSSATCSIPSIAQAYSFNITVVPSTPIGFITAYPTGQPLPLAGTLVWSQGSITSNAAVVPGGTSGSIDVFANSATDVVIDINGYYVPLTLAQGSGVPTTLLFPWVISAGGYDSLLLISNVSLTPNPAITPQSGTCTFNYFGVGTGTNSAPPAPQTSLAVSGGQTLTLSLSAGSTQFSLHGTPGFSGYIYAICNFKAYAAAVLTALGAGPLSTGISAALPVVINP